MIPSNQMPDSMYELFKDGTHEIIPFKLEEIGVHNIEQVLMIITEKLDKPFAVTLAALVAVQSVKSETVGL